LFSTVVLTACSLLTTRYDDAAPPSVFDRIRSPTMSFVLKQTKVTGMDFVRNTGTQGNPGERSENNGSCNAGAHADQAAAGAAIGRRTAGIKPAAETSSSRRGGVVLLPRVEAVATHFNRLRRAPIFV
jgi:hypothetical protein